MKSTPEMVDSVNALILAYRIVTIKDISALGIFVVTTHRIVYDDIVVRFH